MIGWAEGLMDIVRMFPLLKQCLGSHQRARNYHINTPAFFIVCCEKTWYVNKVK